MTTALAIRPKEQALEFRRCTGHCCDPVTLAESPGYFRAGAVRDPPPGDLRWVAENLIYLGWRAPSQGGWPGTGNHEYRCPHFDAEDRRCLIYGQGKRTRLCRRYPEYDYGLWEFCRKPGCTRRTIVIGMDRYPLRWRFPDLWAEDYDRWHAWESRVCRPEWGPEAIPEGAEI